MLTLAIRTDKPEAELYFFNGDNKLAELKWTAHRQLAETINRKINELLSLNGLSLENLESDGKIAVYSGPGSFTGLRIGVSVANALGYGLSIPIVAGTGEKWLEQCLSDKTAKDFVPIQIEYGSEPHITEQKK